MRARVPVLAALAAAAVLAPAARADQANGRLVDRRTGAIYTYAVTLPAGWQVVARGREPAFGTHLVAASGAIAAVRPAAAASAAEALRSLAAAAKGSRVAALGAGRAVLRDARARVLATAVDSLGPDPRPFVLTPAGPPSAATSTALLAAGRTLRLFFGADDPSAIVSDTAGRALAERVAEALATAPGFSASVGVDPAHPLLRLEVVPPSGFLTSLDAATGMVLEQDADGRRNVLDGTRHCFVSTPLDAAHSGVARWAATLGAGSYALRYDRPTALADGTERLRFSFYARGGSRRTQAQALVGADGRPAEIAWSTPGAPATLAYAMQFDYAATVVVRPPPEPAC